jgi:hypothetical protein
LLLISHGQTPTLLYTEEGSKNMPLEERCANDPNLLEFNHKKLLIPGWAGELSPDELTYIKSQLKQSPSLKRRWGFKPSAKRFSESRIRAVARDGLSAKRSCCKQEASFSFSCNKGTFG